MSHPIPTRCDMGALSALILFSAAACGEEVAPQPPATRQECLAAADFVKPPASPYCLPYGQGSSHSVSQS